MPCADLVWSRWCDPPPIICPLPARLDVNDCLPRSCFYNFHCISRLLAALYSHWVFLDVLNFFTFIIDWSRQLTFYTIPSTFMLVWQTIKPNSHLVYVASLNVCVSLDKLQARKMISTYQKEENDPWVISFISSLSPCWFTPQFTCACQQALSSHTCTTGGPSSESLANDPQLYALHCTHKQMSRDASLLSSLEAPNKQRKLASPLNWQSVRKVKTQSAEGFDTLP